jgi:hypothetical protein
MYIAERATDGASMAAEGVLSVAPPGIPPLADCEGALHVSAET